MIIASKTDIGAVRTENQDREFAEFIGEGSALAVVCDGMGGQNAGSVASSMVIREFTQRIKAGFSEQMRPQSIKNLMMTAIEAANTEAFEKSSERPDYQGMGTTCVAALLSGAIAGIINVGDSRAYIIRNGEIEQITEDHTLVNMWVAQGKITEEEAVKHPQKNLITRAVGIQQRVRADYFEFDIEPEDKILLCSDGLSNYCGEDKLLAEISEKPPKEAIDSLVGFAKESGGSDNITAVIICISDKSEVTEDGR